MLKSPLRSVGALMAINSTWWRALSCPWPGRQTPHCTTHGALDCCVRNNESLNLVWDPSLCRPVFCSFILLVADFGLVRLSKSDDVHNFGMVENQLDERGAVTSSLDPPLIHDVSLKILHTSRARTFPMSPWSARTGMRSRTATTLSGRALRAADFPGFALCRDFFAQKRLTRVRFFHCFIEVLSSRLVRLA